MHGLSFFGGCGFGCITAVFVTAQIGFGHFIGLFDCLCTDSRALPAAMALLKTATAVSEPAGAFFEAFSTTAMNFFVSFACASKALPNSAPVLDVMSYR